MRRMTSKILTLILSSGRDTYAAFELYKQLFPGFTEYKDAQAGCIVRHGNRETTEEMR